MSVIRLQWAGLQELIAELRRLPVALRDDAAAIVAEESEGAAADVRAGYAAHRVTGNLEDHVVVTKSTGAFGTGAVVKSQAKHAYMFEVGTMVRQTASGATRGFAEPGNVFIPAVQRRRRAMYERLKVMLTAHGLTVSGNA